MTSFASFSICEYLIILLDYIRADQALLPGRIAVMKKLLFPTICIILFVISFSSVVIFQMIRAKAETAKVPLILPTPTLTPYLHDSNPPKESLIGKVSKLVGTGTKLARDVDDPVVVELNQDLLEAEQLTASPSSSITISFADDAQILMGPESVLAFPSTNPKNFLVKQDAGEVTYLTDDTIATISARSLHGLFSLSQGKARLAIDPDTASISFSISEGDGQIGYIDKENKTQVVELSAGKTAIFDDEKRKIKIK
jgi:hypothetical protein